jgi:hypothetical protein
MFVPEAQALPRAEFRQLLRIAAGTHRNGLRLVALFVASSPDCEERIADMGTQIARWDLDEEAAADHGRSSLPISGLNTTRLSIMSMTGKLAGNSGRWLAAAGVAAMLALLPAFIPLSSNAPDLAHTDEPTLTRSGMVELAGEPRQDFVRAQQAADDARVDQAALRPASADSLQGATDIVLHDTGEAHGTSAASSPEAGSR